MFKKILSYLSVRFSGTATEQETQRRLAICAECEFKKVVPHKTEWRVYCKGGCGCGQWRDSELLRRASFAKDSCPKGKWATATAVTAVIKSKPPPPARMSRGITPAQKKEYFRPIIQPDLNEPEGIKELPHKTT